MYLKRVLFRYREIFYGKEFDSFKKEISDNIIYLDKEVDRIDSESTKNEDSKTSLMEEYRDNFTFSFTMARAIYENKKRLESHSDKEKIKYFVEKSTELFNKGKSINRESRDTYKKMVSEKKRLTRLNLLQEFVLEIKEYDFSDLIKDAKNLNLKIIKLCGWLYKNEYSGFAKKSYELMYW